MVLKWQHRKNTHTHTHTHTHTGAYLGRGHCAMPPPPLGRQDCKIAWKSKQNQGMAPPLEVVHKVWCHKGYVLNIFSKLTIRFGRRPFFFCSSPNFRRKIGPSSSPNFVRIIGLILGETISDSDVCSSQSYWSSCPPPPPPPLQQPYLLIGTVPLVRSRWLVITLGIRQKIFEKCPLYAI